MLDNPEVKTQLRSKQHKHNTRIYNEKMTDYILEVNNRNYTDVVVRNRNTQCIEEDLLINPAQHKLFHGDIFLYDEGHCIKLETTSNLKKIAGVLMLEGNKTFGREKNRLLYKCIPYDKRLPVFLVPYEMKIGFNKHYKNKYVLFSFVHWNDKHPYGKLDETIGDVTELTHTSDYLIYCAGLHYSYKMVNNKVRSIKSTYDVLYQELVNSNKYNLQERYDDYVFSIDPLGSTDLDDAFSIEVVSEHMTIIRVYIANVSVWLDYFDVWTDMSEQCSTIYLPNKKRSMLPSILGDDYCSLKEKKQKITQVYEFIIKDGVIIHEETKCYNACIHVKKNFHYEDNRLENNEHYWKFMLCTKLLTNNPNLDSHELVSYWMIKSNKWMANTLSKYKKGMFRISHFTNKVDDTITNKETRHFIQNYLNSHCEYSLYQEQLQHELMEQDKYLHVTSPIRRMTDIINQTIYHQEQGLSMSIYSYDFVNKWLTVIHKLNDQVKKIKKVQNQMNILYAIEHNQVDISKSYVSCIFQKECVDDGYMYQVFIKELSLFQQVYSTNSLDMYSDVEVKIFYMNDEFQTYKKIRCTMV